jgi:tripartite-type tricarboxylate transporter receptor subunit TctC
VFWFHYTPDLLVVPEASPIRSFADFLKAAKADPGKLNLGGSGLNSANHAAHERLAAAFGIKTTYVPYKGTGDMALAILGSHIDGAMTYIPFAIANKGRVRPLAVAMEARHPLLPDVPTFKELGYDIEGAGWYAAYAPAKTPKDVVDRLSTAIIEALKSPDVREKLDNLGMEPTGFGPAELARIHRADYDKWGPVIKASGFKPGS